MQGPAVGRSPPCHVGIIHRNVPGVRLVEGVIDRANQSHEVEGQLAESLLDQGLIAVTVEPFELAH